VRASVASYVPFYYSLTQRSASREGNRCYLSHCISCLFPQTHTCLCPINTSLQSCALWNWLKLQCIPFTKLQNQSPAFLKPVHEEIIEHSEGIPINNQLDAQFLLYIFISILYMFRTTLCSSSGESIVSIQHQVYVSLCRWPSGMQVGKKLPDLHTGRSPPQTDIYQMLYW